MMFFHAARRRTHGTEIASLAIFAGPWSLAQFVPMAQGPAEAWMNGLGH